MNLDLADQVAVVVGAARGIGRAIAEALLAEDMRAMLVDRDESVVAAATEIAGQRGDRTLSMVADATEFAAMRLAVVKVMNHWNRCDHVIYAAGQGSGKYGFPFWNLRPEDWRSVLEVNLMGAVNTLHAFAPTMIKARRGTILLLGSVAGQIGSQTDPPYSAAKAALVNFAQCAARDLAPHQIRVNTICPGMVETTLNRSVWEAWRKSPLGNAATDYAPWAEAKIKQVSPLGRWQTPQEMAALAAFLCSDHARNMTGQTLNVDGGQVMR